MRIISVITVSLVLLTISCSPGPTAGNGSGTETTNSFAYLASGAPAANCTVRVIESQAWIGAARASSSRLVIDSTVTAADGFFSIEYERSAENTTLNLQLDHDSAGLFTRDLSLDRMDSTVFTLEKYSVVRGAAGNGLIDASVLMEGTTYDASIADDGTFVFPRIPPGQYALYVKQEDNIRTGGSVDVPSDSEVQIQVAQYAPDEFLLTDFEVDYTVPHMNAAGKPVFWYLFSDSASKRFDFETHTWEIYNSDDFEKTGNTSVSSQITTASEEETKALQLDAYLDQDIPVSYAGLGIVFYSDGNRGLDLSTMTGIRCMLGGQGRVKVNLICRHPDNESDVRFSLHHELPQSLTAVRFDIDSFSIESSTPDSLVISPLEARKRVHLLEYVFFSPDNTAEHVYFTIDDLVFEGVRIEDLLK